MQDEFYGMTPELRGMYLKQRQGLSLSMKIELSKRRIRAWYEQHDGHVYVSFSGGKDSTVLLDLVRSEFPDVPAVFVDTGLEFPEIRDFVKTILNVEWLKPKKTFKQVIEEHGYPVIGKEVSKKVSELRNTKSDYLRNKRWNGDDRGNGKLNKKWRFLVDAPFKISDYCCTVLKKSPLKIYNTKSKRVPYIGIMAADSRMREQHYINYGCNILGTGTPQSNPMAFWLESDVWEYLHTNEIPYSSIYDKGYTRTGCVFCAFGVDQQTNPNKFQLLEQTHPEMHRYCINQLGLGTVLDYIGIPYQAAAI